MKKTPRWVENQGDAGFIRRWGNGIGGIGGQGYELSCRPLDEQIQDHSGPTPATLVETLDGENQLFILDPHQLASWRPSMEKTKFILDPHHLSWVEVLDRQIQVCPGSASASLGQVFGSLIVFWTSDKAWNMMIENKN